jgi:hypothetical protein
LTVKPVGFSYWYVLLGTRGTPSSWSTESLIPYLICVSDRESIVDLGVVAVFVLIDDVDVDVDVDEWVDASRGSDAVVDVYHFVAMVISFLLCDYFPFLHGPVRYLQHFCCILVK